MRRAAASGLLVGLTLLFGSGYAMAQTEPMDSGKAFTKLTRGFINTITGWVEVPKRVQETSAASGPLAGFTWGLLRGFGYGFIRTAAGLYEVFTFPFPAPSGYEPVMHPEYVFQEDASASGAPSSPAPRYGK